tara:strand:- start:223 stop:501 length:279 start_codon:yes stop_codon:yes gene_type:complete
MLTREENNIESGTYATKDTDGIIIVQFFVDKDDAMCYIEQLKAVDYDLHITEVPDDAIDKLCDAMGYAYSVAEPGELIFPRFENLEKILTDL